MKFSKKTLAALVAAGVMAGGAIAVAAPNVGNCGGQPGAMRDSMRNGNFDPAAFAEQRLSRFKADLKITAEQEPLWNAFADKTKSEAGKGYEYMRAQADATNLTAPERMNQHIAMMKQRIASMETVNDSFNRLYEALTPEQRKVADDRAARMGHFGFKRTGHHGYRGYDRMPPQAPTKG